MKENKNIERLFQEKFKDFEVTPPDFLWENIQEKLNPEKKKRRVIPFWFKASGIAASFVALFSVLYFNSDLSSSNNNSSKFNTNGLEQNSNSVSTTIEKESASSNNKEAINTDDKALGNHNNATVSNSTSESYSNLKSESTNNTTTRSESNSTRKSLNNSVITSKNTNSKSHKNNSAITYNSKKNNRTNSKKNINNGTTDIALASNHKTIKNKKAKTSKSNSKIQYNTNTEFQFDLSNAVLAQNNQNQIKTGNQNQTASIDFDINNNNNSAKLNLNNSIISNENNTAVTTIIGEPKTDSIVLATVQTEENPLEKLLREKESKIVAKEKDDLSKWAVISFISPVYFNSFSEGSPLSQEFATNNKTYNNTLSYGVGLSYQLSKKLTVKTGIGNLNLDYSTNDVVFYSSYEDQTGKADTNIKRNQNGKYLVLKNQLEKTVNIGESEMFISGQNTGNLNQQIQYIEVPMEMSYAILDKKFGVALKGGMSTLFLTKNSVAIETNNGNMEIGKASNLSSVHFSSNIGLGFNYNFLKNFQVNVEPTLKYQINTFNENAGNFKPYVIGINTGLSYKF